MSPRKSGSTLSLFNENGESIMARVAFENVVKKYGDVTAVNNLNIDVADKGIPGARRTFGLRQDNRFAVWPDWKRLRVGTLRSPTA